MCGFQKAVWTGAVCQRSPHRQPIFDGEGERREVGRKAGEPKKADVEGILSKAKPDRSFTRIFFRYAMLTEAGQILGDGRMRKGNTMEYRKRLAAFALLASTGLTLVACGGTTAAVQQSPSGRETPAGTAPTVTPIPKATSTPTPTQYANKSIRGNVVAHIGDTGTVTDSDSGAITFKFTITAIHPVACNQQFSHLPENGHIFGIDITAETTPDLAASTFPKFGLNATDFKFISKNGTTFNGNLRSIGTMSCIAQAPQLPMEMGPAEKAAGTILVDLPETTGVLVLETGYKSGLEYNF